MSDADLDRALAFEDSFTRPVGMWTPGIDKSFDWCQHKVSLATALVRHTDYEATHLTMLHARINHPYRGDPNGKPGYR